MSLRFSSLQRRRGLLFNFTILLFLALIAVALVFSTRCNFQTPCTPSDVIDNKWLTLWGLRSPNEGGSFSINDRQGSTVIEVEEEVIGPAYCPVCGPGDALCAKYGSHNLVRSIAYEGSAARLRRVMENAAQGRPTRIGVLGGSVTAGHGVKTEENWTTLVMTWFQETFPQSNVTLTNGAIPATGSAYYSTCYMEHMDPEMDIIFIELAINDQRNEDQAEAYEWLLRALLALPTKPAVIHVQTFGLIFQMLTTGGDLHTGIAQYYDNPIISIRNVLLPHILAQKDPIDVIRHWFGKVSSASDDPDMRHLGIKGHAMLADLINAFLQRINCQMLARSRHYTGPLVLPGNEDPLHHEMQHGLLPNADILENDIPRLRLFQAYDDETVVGTMSPMCMSTRTDRHPLIPSEQTGWRNWTWDGGWKKKSYVVADEPGARIAFDLRLGEIGRVRVTHLMSHKFGLGKLGCWVERTKDGEVVKSASVGLDGYWTTDLNVASVSSIVDGVPPGPVKLVCEVMKDTSDPEGGHEFRLIAVDSA